MTLPRYGEYKDSGVEWLGNAPAHWLVKRLRFLAHLNPSKSEVSNLDRDTEVSFLPMEAIGDDGALNLERTRPLGEVETGYTYFRDGDVTIAKITPCFENGKGAVMRELKGTVGFGTTELIVARPRRNETFSDYLHWLFISPPFRKLGEAAMYGAGGQKRVPDDFVRDFAIAFPPLPEQTAIAAFLDRETGKIDALVAEQEKLITLLKEKRQAVISHAVTKGLDPTAPMKDTGIEWLGEVPAHWDVCHLKRMCEKVTDGAHVSPETDGGVYHFVSTKDIGDSSIDFDNCLRTSESSFDDLVRSGCRPIVGDVLFSKDGTIGRTVVVDEDRDFVVASSLIIIRPEREHLYPEFLNCLCRSGVVAGQVESFVKGAGLPRLSIQNLLRVLGIFPPLREQTAIAAFLDSETAKLDALTAEAGRAISLLKERRSALISAAVTGKIDVRGLVSIQEEAA
jgi:type I restriction enzyme, S subunit